MFFYPRNKVFLAAFGAMMLSGTASATCDLGVTCRLANPDPNVEIIPFSAPATTTISDVSSHTIPGLDPGERLCPVKCPVDVDIPEDGKILGCYDICKPLASVQTTRPTSHVQTVSRTQTQNRTEHVVQYEPYLVNPVAHTTHVRVIRPVIYVRYPVPVPVTPCGRIIQGPMPRC